MPTLAPPPAAFAARMSRISVSATAAVVMEAERLRAAGRDLVDFGAGEPDFPTPAHIKRAAQQALDENFTRYTAAGGIAPLKDAIRQAHDRDFASGYAREEVLVTCGGKHALFNAISALVEHGDEVILPAPYWVSFHDQITYAGGIPVIVATDEAAGFTLTIDAITSRLTPRTRIILLNSPANPSGAVFAPELFRAVLEICRERGIWLLSDECYSKFVYSGQPYSAATDAAKLPGAKERLIVAGSFSKTYAMTGWRLGYALAPALVIKQMLKLQSHSTSNATSFVQKAGIAALNGPQEPVREMLAEYARRRELIVTGLRAIPGITCNEPAGAFYAYPNITGAMAKKGIATPLDFAGRLLQEAGVVTVPGEAFGTGAHIRFSYAASQDAIREGLKRLTAFCA
jgi:aspartate aminotransferase